MADPKFSSWPILPGRKVVAAEAKLLDKHQRLYCVVLTDSAEKQLTIQLPEAALRSIAETALRLLDE